MASWDGLDRRKFPRANYPCLVVIRRNDKEKEVFLTHTENIGIGGVCVILKKDIGMFAQVDLELDLLDMGNHIKCNGKVVWNVQRKLSEKKHPLFYDIGIEFVGIEEKEHQRLGEIVKRLNVEQEDSPLP